LSYRLAARVGAYVKFTDDDGRQYCEACNIPKILDRDSTNWNDLLLDISAEIKLGSKHKLRVTYWDNMSRRMRGYMLHSCRMRGPGRYYFFFILLMKFCSRFDVLNIFPIWYR